MMDKKHIAEWKNLSKKALSIDKARIQLSRISKFGMLELSRQKKKQSTIQEISYTKCPSAKAAVLRPSLEYAALGAFRKNWIGSGQRHLFRIKNILPHEIADYILNRKRSELLNLESTFVLTCILRVYGDIVGQVEIQQTIKEKTVDAPEPHEEIPLKTEETSVLATDEKGSVNGEGAPKKKSRRRPRH